MENAFCTVNVNGQPVSVSVQQAEELCPDGMDAIMDAAIALHEALSQDDEAIEAAKAVLGQRMDAVHRELAKMLTAE